MIEKPFQIQLENNQAYLSAQKIATTLINNGHQAVIAGGAIRDLLLGKTPKDFDIATSAEPKEVLGCFKKTQKVGIAFGVVLVHDFGEAIEVATFRKDGEYQDGRRPESVEFCDAEQDAQRRDFTVNGLFYDFAKKTIIDYVGGLEDLENKTIRAIRNPRERFEEDYLRMIRAIRFAVVLNFNIEPKTFEAIQENSEQITKIAADRIHVELRKTFSKNCDMALNLLDQSQLAKHLFPYTEKTSFDLNSYPVDGDFIACLALYLTKFEDHKQLNSVLQDLRCTNDEKRDIRNLLKFHKLFSQFNCLKEHEQKKCIRSNPIQRSLYFASRIGVSQNEVSKIHDNSEKWDKKDLFPPHLPTGKELIQRGLKPGPKMGNFLENLENDLLDGKLKTQDEVNQVIEKQINS